jgi:hypothetical protein
MYEPGMCQEGDREEEDERRYVERGKRGGRVEAK